ncbi:MAG: hypothetical protein KF850_27075 [Labilithrix sp.]|nr:hypothetical protein [Labilithrix sp.]
MTWKTTGVVLGVAAATALASACSAETRAVDLGERGGSSGGFGAVDDAGIDAGDDDASTSRLLCATSECPAGTTTCETSRARCDVDLMSDRNNCGACGAACPKDSVFQRYVEGPFLEVVFFCVSGRCEMACSRGHADGDGAPDNGCEVPLDTRDNCGALGVKCPGNEPCVEGKCGCPPPTINCDGQCTNPQVDPSNCGTCGNACEDPEWPPWEHHYYMQCSKGACGRQCEAPYGDCDQDLETNGCEARLDTNEHCGACGNTCQNGTQCVLVDDAFQCGCPPGLRKCPLYGDLFVCRDVLSDPTNCGGCGVTCQSGESANVNLASSTAVCRGGVCDMLCKSGRADCNGFSGDGCEVDLQTDPHHCGACGRECDLAIGQPCVKGECVVTSCGEGEVPR